MQDATSGRNPRLSLAQAEADLIQLENQKSEAEATLMEIKAKLALYNRQQILGALTTIFIVTIPVVFPILIFLALTKGRTLARRLKEAESALATSLAAMNAKRSEIARIKVELASLGPAYAAQA